MPKTKSKKELSIYILKLLGIGLIFTAATILSPTLLLTLIKRYLSYKFREPPNRKQIQKSLSYLKRKNFIAFENKDNKLKLILTKLGWQHLEKSSLNEIKITPVPWDNQWRVLAFDIPEQFKSARQTLRLKLKQLGFYHFQRSVFILPYPCEKEIDHLTRLLNVYPYVHLLTARRFSNERGLLKKFNLRP